MKDVAENMYVESVVFFSAIILFNENIIFKMSRGRKKKPTKGTSRTPPPPLNVGKYQISNILDRFGMEICTEQDKKNMKKRQIITF